MLLTISETGLGKRTAFSEYPKHGRGGQGVLTHNVTARTGKVVAARAVKEAHELILVSQAGIVMRTTVESIAKVGRSAQGVQVMHPPAGDTVASVALIDLSKTPDAMVLPGDGVPPSGGGSNGKSNGSGVRRSNRRRR
jgi:DNA gyrase subunit A